MEADFEREVQALGRRIAEAGASVPARIYHLSFLTDRLLARAMRHPQFKTQLFRFIDVFPACTNDADVLRHLEEYFEGVDVPGATSLFTGNDYAFRPDRVAAQQQRAAKDNQGD